MPGLQSLRSRAGALAEREFRLLFAATTASALGDAVSLVGLAFAVLAVGDAADLGAVLAVRTAVSAVVVVFGGVLSDRLPRHHVLVGASLVQGLSQAATAVYVLTGGEATVVFLLLAAVWGMGDGLVTPAEVGLVPQTVTPARLQQANALQGLTRSGVRVVGPAVGGALVVAVGPGWALALDSVSFLACAVLLACMRPTRATVDAEPYLEGLRQGWRAFRAQTWLWSTVLVFGVGNMFWAFWAVLGPAVADERLGGAGAWALILAAGGVGAVLGGLLGIRHRPARPLVACILWPLPMAVQLAVLAAGAPVAAVVAVSFVTGAGIAVHVTLWFTTFQREVPAHAQSRVSSYDTLGSFVFTPVGMALAGPLAVALGTDGALWLGALALGATNVLLLAIPAVWRIRDPAQVARAA